MKVLLDHSMLLVCYFEEHAPFNMNEKRQKRNTGNSNMMWRPELPLMDGPKKDAMGAMGAICFLAMGNAVRARAAVG